MRVLVVDIGGSHVKMEVAGFHGPTRFRSGPTMTPRRMVREVQKATAGWKYDVVTVGYPGLVFRDKIVLEPKNLGRGWVGFDFARAFGKPTRMINDAAMQALGSYEGGRMLFLGFGTGLGSALILDGTLEPMELAHMPYRNGKSFEYFVGQRGLDRMGRREWRKHVFRVINLLARALEVDYVVLGGGNTRLLRRLPRGVRRGNNANAFIGGARLWRKSKKGGSRK